MKLKKLIILFCLTGFMVIPFNDLFSQNIQSKPTRQSSMEAFSKGNYEKAYSEFRELLLTYNKDQLYKYYSGVCLVKLKKNPEEAVKLLQEAVQGTGNIKTLPPDGLFYLGRAQQMSGKFTEASESYKHYTEQAGKKTANEMGVPELLQECSQKKGLVAYTETKTTDIQNNNNPDISKALVIAQAEGQAQIPSSEKKAVKENLPANYEKILGEAVDYQFKADSVSAIARDQKKQMENLTGTEKSDMNIRRMNNEKIAASFQAKADQKYQEAQIAMNPGKDSALLIKAAPVLMGNKVINDSVKIKENVPVIPAGKKADTTSVIRSSTVKKAGYLSLFEVLAHPSTDPKANIIMNQEVPAGLVYRIQIAVFRNPVTPAFFKGLSPVCGFKIAGTDKTIYYAGMFRKSSDAGKALVTVKAKGFKDAFIVGLSGNKSVTPDRSASMEKEWSNKPLFSSDKTLIETQADTIPPTLVFRVEVTRSLKPLKEDVVDGIRKIAGSRGLDIITLENGKIDYLIGKFITFETAAEYTDLLKRNGYRDAQVVAWLGEKEIPLETARQLFDNLK